MRGAARQAAGEAVRSPTARAASITRLSQATSASSSPSRVVAADRHGPGIQLGRVGPRSGNARRRRARCSTPLHANAAARSAIETMNARDTEEICSHCQKSSAARDRSPQGWPRCDVLPMVSTPCNSCVALGPSRKRDRALVSRIIREAARIPTARPIGHSRAGTRLPAPGTPASRSPRRCFPGCSPEGSRPGRSRSAASPSSSPRPGP